MSFLDTAVLDSGLSALTGDLSRQPLELDIPGESPRTVYPDCLERRDTGEAPATITRFSIDLSPTPAGSATTSAEGPSGTVLTLEQRVASLETEVATLKTLIRSLANDPR